MVCRPRGGAKSAIYDFLVVVAVLVAEGSERGTIDTHEDVAPYGMMCLRIPATVTHFLLCKDSHT